METHGGEMNRRGKEAWIERKAMGLNENLHATQGFHFPYNSSIVWYINGPFLTSGFDLLHFNFELQMICSRILFSSCS